MKKNCIHGAGELEWSGDIKASRMNKRGNEKNCNVYTLRFECSLFWNKEFFSTWIFSAGTFCTYISIFIALLNYTSKLHTIILHTAVWCVYKNSQTIKHHGEMHAFSFLSRVYINNLFENSFLNMQIPVFGSAWAYRPARHEQKFIMYSFVRHHNRAGNRRSVQAIIIMLKRFVEL
jgi:hypothetical protein